MGKIFKERIETIGLLVMIVAAIAGFLYWAGEPPYANERETNRRFAGYELRYLELRIDNLTRRIFELEMEREKSLKNRQGFPVFMQQELRRLNNLKAMEKEKVEALIKRGRGGK